MEKLSEENSFTSNIQRTSDEKTFLKVKSLVKELREDLRLWNNDAAIDRVQTALTRLCDLIETEDEDGE
jgi:hypothetical protein